MPIPATSGTVAPAEIKTKQAAPHPVPAHTYQQPDCVPQILTLTPQVKPRNLLIVSIVLVAFICSRVMGNPNSKLATQNKITVINLQEELKKYREILQNTTSAIYQNFGPLEGGFTSVGFHGETLMTIMLILAIIALATYAGYNCLRRGALCPKYLEMEEAVRKTKEDRAVKRYPSLYPDLVRVASQLPMAPQLAVLPGEHTNGVVWTTAPMDGYGGYNRNPTTDVERSKFHGSTATVFPSAANRPSFVQVPPAASMNLANCG